MRQTLLSCSSRVAAPGRLRFKILESAARVPAFGSSCAIATALARSGMTGFAMTLAASAPALAGDLPHPIPALVELNRQEMAVLTTALALLGFSAVSAILLMRTRVRAARNEARLRGDIVKLQAHADRYRALNRFKFERCDSSFRRFLHSQFSVHDLDSYRSTPEGDTLDPIRARRG